MSDSSEFVRVIEERDSQGKILAVVCRVWCPGCELSHRMPIRATNSTTWDWNGDLDKPTFSPSILVRWVGMDDGKEKRCHSFIRDGMWQFLEDSTHALAGQTVKMEPVPDWVGVHHTIRGQDD